jgi:hypothetical protein
MKALRRGQRRIVRRPSGASGRWLEPCDGPDRTGLLPRTPGQRADRALDKCAPTLAEHLIFHTRLVLCSAAYETERVSSARCLVWVLALGIMPWACSRAPGSSEARGAAVPSVALPPVEANELRPLSAFEVLPAGEERARAVFGEAARVLLHPRCVNCHVSGDVPAQGPNFARHEPPVVRGPEDRGVVGMECGGCHQDRNLELSRVPGAPDWRLPPRVMAWVGRTPDQLCEQLVDRQRNGGRSLEEVIDHVGHDAFVAWGWSPGADRPPAPGSHQEFAALMTAWVDNGAACPTRAGESL